MDRKGQHFLLSAKARTLSLMQIFRLSDEGAWELFKEARWPNNEVACPCCGNMELYWIGTRKQWRCKAKECKHTFSVTSGTLFHSHKKPLVVYLAAIALYTNAVKGISALQVSRDLDVQYKTAFVLCHKLRESLVNDQEEQLTGEVEIDAAYVNQHVRPQNRIEDRVDRRLAKNQNPKKRALHVLRQRGEDQGEGAVKTLTFLARRENQQIATKIARENVSPDAIMHADDHMAYDALHGHFTTVRVNHKTIYVGPNGENTNQAESFFSRFRRMQYGQHHQMDNRYMLRYANEIAYREDTRRQSNGAIFGDITKRCAAKGPSREFCGYWQGNKATKEGLVG